MSCVVLTKCVTKRVTFSADCKDYDGPTTRYNFLYAVFCIGFFKGNLQTRVDVLRYCEDDRDFIDFCLREAMIAKGKFNNLKEREKEYQKEYKRRAIMGDGSLWATRPGIPVIRVGTSNKIGNFKFYTEHFAKICEFIRVLQEADDYLFDCNK